MSMKLTRTLLVVALASAAGLPLQAAERSWSYSYTSQGLIESADGPRTDVQDITRYAYDGQGHLTSVTNALGHLTQLSNYDADGHPQSITDANNVSTSLTYAPQGWLASISTAGSTTSFEHDAVGQITKVTRGDGSWLTYTWDDARRLTAISNNLGETVEYDLDAMGNRTAQRIKDASNNLTQQQQWAYDELGRLLRSVGAAGQASRVQYDLNDNPTVRTNPKQNSHVRAYDALDRLVASSDPLNGVTALAYDAQDHLTQVSDPRGVTTRYVYDGLGNLTQLSSPDSGTTTYAHDAAGNVIQQTDARGVVTEYRYDALNRLIARRYPANPALNVQYHHDMTAEGNRGIGRLTAVQDASGVLGYTYDGRGNLIEQIRSVEVLGSDRYDRLQYAYDGANQLTRITYPDGFAIDYSRNAAGQVQQVSLAVGNSPSTPLASAISYQPFGPLKSLTWGNGIALNRSYDQDYRLTQQQVGVWQSGYRYDANGNITRHAHSLFGTLDYQYDALDRLSEEKAASERKTYSYDATGNRTLRRTYRTTDGVESAYNAQPLVTATNSNRLLKNVSTTVQMDASGNALQHALSRRYTYDEQGRLKQAFIPTTTTTLSADYRYNALGQRTLKQRYSSGRVALATTYLYGADGQLLGEVQYNPNGKKYRATYWIWLEGMPLASYELKYATDGVTVLYTRQYYLHSDHLNTPRLATDPDQQLLWYWNSDAFGAGAATNNLIVINLRFPGQYYDQESGLHYNYFRDYDPETGRYVESDPIGLEGGLNTYGYVQGNPLTTIDPKGLMGYCGTPGGYCGPPSTKAHFTAGVCFTTACITWTEGQGGPRLEVPIIPAISISAGICIPKKPPAVCPIGDDGSGGKFPDTTSIGYGPGGISNSDEDVCIELGAGYDSPANGTYDMGPAF